jgi:phosphoribosyl-ATP pyrophosphohydrolase|tara:strand:- start:3110 stop:3436 length:327 start_codon:yes stop_codon:yes gene_type:complete
MENKLRFNLIRSWAKEKGILDKGDIRVQTIKVQEECGELSSAVLKNDKAEIIDAVGDIVVVLTSLSYLGGFTIEEAIDSAYKEISNRKGKMVNGDFVKNTDHIIAGTE